MSSAEVDPLWPPGGCSWWWCSGGFWLHEPTCCPTHTCTYTCTYTCTHTKEFTHYCHDKRETSWLTHSFWSHSKVHWMSPWGWLYLTACCDVMWHVTVISCRGLVDLQEGPFHQLIIECVNKQLRLKGGETEIKFFMIPCSGWHGSGGYVVYVSTWPRARYLSQQICCHCCSI